MSVRRNDHIALGARVQAANRFVLNKALISNKFAVMVNGGVLIVWAAFDKGEQTHNRQKRNRQPAVMTHDLDPSLRIEAELVGKQLETFYA